jgi:hypothetical protein
MEQIIKQGVLKDNVYYLPNVKLDRKEYLDIAEHLKFLGGKWKGRGLNGFIFDRQISSIDELLGNNIKVKKDIQLFETPESIADKLVEYAEIDNYQTILEPSAGRGRIIKSIQKVCSCQIDYCEINDVNRKYLDEIKNINFLEEDFLKLKTNKKYTRILANPPFAKNQDIDHIMKMYELLSEKGILVSISSNHWQMAKEKKCQEFRKFIEYTNAEVIELQNGDFKESGTLVKGNIIIIRK